MFKIKSNVSEICLCLTGRTLAAWQQQVANNRRWISMVEMRVDLLDDVRRIAGIRDTGEATRQIAEVSSELTGFAERTLLGLPKIVTCRRTADLGAWEGDERLRQGLLAAIIERIKPEYLDLEIDRPDGVLSDDRAESSLRELLSEPGAPTVVRSYHDPEGVPDDLDEIFARAAENETEIPKVAVAPRGAHDLLRLTMAADRFYLRHPSRKLLALGMGPYGLPTRAFPARMGAPWSYASETVASQAAPGQFSPRELHELFRVGQARADWPSLLVVGDPILHSKSPEYHNRLLAASAVNAVYLPMQIDRFDLFPRLAHLFNARGASITVPHKRAAAEFAHRRTERVAAIGAANTLYLEGHQWVGENTDVDGFLVPLQELLGRLDVSTRGLSTVVVGAGGASRAAVSALLEVGAEVWIANRSLSRAQEVARAFSLNPDRAVPLDAGAAIKRIPNLRLIVQTTTVGMDPDIDGDPIPKYKFSGTEIVYDIVYAPPETVVLKRAAAAGCTTLNGSRMFEEQANRQFELFRSAISPELRSPD